MTREECNPFAPIEHTVRDNETGMVLTFRWKGNQPPAAADLAKVFAQAQRAPTLYPALRLCPSGSMREDCNPFNPAEWYPKYPALAPLLSTGSGGQHVDRRQGPTIEHAREHSRVAAALDWAALGAVIALESWAITQAVNAPTWPPASLFDPYEYGTFGSLYYPYAPYAALSPRTYLGRLEGNPYSPDSTGNPYGAYGSPYAPNGLNNPNSVFGSPYSPTSPANPYAINTPRLFGQDGRYLGKLSTNPYDPDSVSNPYGPFGSRFSPDSINNPFGPYGSPFSPLSPSNPFTSTPPLILGR